MRRRDFYHKERGRKFGYLSFYFHIYITFPPLPESEEGVNWQCNKSSKRSLSHGCFSHHNYNCMVEIKKIL